MLKTAYLLLVAIFVTVSQSNAQSVVSNTNKHEYSAGGLLFWENNVGNLGAGLYQEYRYRFNNLLSLAAGVSAIQSISYWAIDVEHSSHSGIIPEVGLQVSPSGSKRLSLGIAGMYQYGSETYTNYTVETVNNNGQVIRTADYATNVLSRLGYSINAGYLLSAHERFTTRVALKINSFEYFGEMAALNFQVGYCF